MQDRSDETLLLSYRDGDVDAFAALFRRHRGPLFNFLLRRVRDRGRAEELYQDVWTKVIDRCDDFRGDAKFSTWLYTIARNHCTDHARRMKHRMHESLDTTRSGTETTLLERVENPGPSTEALATGAALQERIANAVDALPDDQQEVFLLRQLEGLSFKEIAEIVHAPVNTVKSRMRYALERLQRELADLEEEPR
jgi:RNA polymerase sigma-70 factor (ECF subfamily)